MKKKNSKKIFLFLLIILFFFCLGYLITIIENEGKTAKITESKQIAMVNKTIDGDTIKTDLGEVRLLGINTPEKKERLYEEAKNFTSQLENKEVILIKTNEDKDKYGRLLRYVEYNDKIINEEILKNGLATLYYYDYDSYYEKLKKAEEQSRNNKLGLWQESQNICKSCIKLKELNNIDPGEYVILKNECDFSCNLTNWEIKDDANHLKKLNFSLSSKEEIKITYSQTTWNDDKDTFYLRDEQGYLVLFYRYGYH